MVLDDHSNKALRDPDAMLRPVKDNIRNKEDYHIILDEIQYMNKFEDVLNSLLSIPDLFWKIIVVGDNIKIRWDENGIISVGLRNFLLDENSLRL